MFTRRSCHVRDGSSSSTAPPQQVLTQGIVFTDRGARKKFQKLTTRKIKATKWACAKTLAKLGITHDFNLLYHNAGLHHFVYQGCETYERLTLEFLSTLSHNVGLMPNAYAEERITFRLLDQDFNITFAEWCNYFGFPNNDDDVRYVYDSTDPHPRQSRCRHEEKFPK